jgi:hypothetical protein
MEIRYRVDLYKLLPSNPVTAELGVAEGFFSTEILSKWNPALHYAVDNWSPIGDKGDGSFPKEWHDKNYEDAMKRMDPFKKVVKILRGPTWRMCQHVPDKTLDIVYIDADHSYEGVKKDLEAWYPKVKPGGVIAGHDFINPAYGVSQAVNEFALNNKGIKVNVIKENHDDDAGFWFYKLK